MAKQQHDCLRRALSAPVYELARRTPLDHAPRMSGRIGTRLWLKREDLQPTFSFKLRGAYNCIRRLSDVQRARGVVAASAGNHAQGVALSARELGVKATIFMPRTTPEIKVRAVAELGASIEMAGDDYDAACAQATIESCAKLKASTPARRMERAHANSFMAVPPAACSGRSARAPTVRRRGAARR